MSRSRRRTPITGMTTEPSDKPGKVLAHRAARRLVRQTLHETGDGDALPHPKQHGDPWLMPKDGKHWHGKRYPELLRK